MNQVGEGPQRTTLTVNEVAEYLGVSTDMVYKLVREKKVPVIRLGRRILFKRNSLDQWLNRLEEHSEVS